MTGGMEDEIGGITGIMRQADLQRKGHIGQFYAAEGGRPWWKFWGDEEAEAGELNANKKKIKLKNKKD